MNKFTTFELLAIMQSSCAFQELVTASNKQ